MGNTIFSSCKYPPPPPSSFRSILDEKSIMVGPDGCFKDHLARVNDMSEFHKKYTLGRVLGEGITGQVRLITSIADGQVFAMKSLNLAKMDANQIFELRREIETLRSLDHPNIISLMEVFQNEDNIYIVMEHCSGTDLGHRKLKSEAEVCSIIYQLTDAVAHCHYKNVVHRDLKLENIMFASESGDSIRLIDFGLSKRFLSREDIIAGEAKLSHRRRRLMETACGTAFYMAPEMLNSTYSEKADIWAIGVITYMILTGHPPFDGYTEKQVFAKLKRAQVSYADPVWKTLSPDALAFVKRMLSVDPNKRPSAKEALQLDWLSKFAQKRNAEMQGSVRGKELARRVCESVTRFATYPKLKRIALIAVAHHLNEKDTRELREFFSILDEEHSGLLGFEDMHTILQDHCGLVIGKEDFQVAFNEMDQELEGNVDHSEFLAAALESQVELTPELLNLAFDDFTCGGSGGFGGNFGGRGASPSTSEFQAAVIDPENLQQMMGRKYTLADTEDIIVQAYKYCGLEPPKDRKMTREVFLVLMERNKPAGEEEKGENGRAAIPDASKAEQPSTTTTTALVVS